jgi:hypothetical protein
VPPSSLSSPTSVDDLLAALWRDYVALTPQALHIHDLLTARGETLINDHVALRTFDLPGIGIGALARTFERHGWIQRDDDYRFPDKHLRARYWQHPEPGRPKIFISELMVDELPAAAAHVVRGLHAGLPPGFTDRDDLAWAGRPWTIAHETYAELLESSEYAAWVAAFGFRVNHFTVDVGSLRTFADLPAVNAFLVDAGIELNTVGGTIKGTPAQYLEQSSTRADDIDLAFADGTFRVPSCYYEFARRYPLPSGQRFEGFVPSSADKIFHSTDVRR